MSEVKINRFDLRVHSMWVNKPDWIVKTKPSSFSMNGVIWEGTYVTNRSGDCLHEVKKPFKLDRLKREFVRW